MTKQELFNHADMRKKTRKHSKAKGILNIIAGILQFVNGVLQVVAANKGEEND